MTGNSKIEVPGGRGTEAALKIINTALEAWKHLMFKPGAKLTLVMRNPVTGDSLVVSEDDLRQVLALLAERISPTQGEEVQN